MMVLGDVLNRLDSFASEALIYARKPWTEASVAVVEIEPDDGTKPEQARSIGATYFLEVNLAREIAELYRQRVQTGDVNLPEVIIHYAVNDAYHPSLIG